MFLRRRARQKAPLPPAVCYLLALLPLLLCESLLFPRLPFEGAQPFLLPAAVCLLSLREGVAGGAFWGAVFGLFAVLLGEGLAMLFLLSLLGAVCGYAFCYGLQRGFLSCLLAVFLGQLGLTLLHMGVLSIRFGAHYFALFAIALPELLWSLCFFPLVYLLFLPPTWQRGGVPA